MRSVVSALVLIACALALVDSAAGEDLAASRRARALSGELMSPFCPGRTLSDCPSPNASAVRDEIRAWVDQGRSDAEIRAELRARFGASLVGEPQGFWGRAAPLAMIGLVGLVFAFGLRRVVGRSDSPE